MKRVTLDGQEFQDLDFVPSEDGPPPEVVASLNRLRENIHQQREAAILACAALYRLCDVMKHRSGQPYKVRELLFSLWNGKPARLNELLGLDWNIRQDMCSVMLAFGFEDRDTKFFYRAFSDAMRAAGQWDWFLEERHNKQPMKDWLDSTNL